MCQPSLLEGSRAALMTRRLIYQLLPVRVRLLKEEQRLYEADRRWIGVRRRGQLNWMPPVAFRPLSEASWSQQGQPCQPLRSCALRRQGRLPRRRVTEVGKRQNVVQRQRLREQVVRMVSHTRLLPVSLRNL